MSKKIVRAWGLLLAVMLIASMLVPAAPAMAVYGTQQALAQTLPSNSNYVLAGGSDITDIAAGTGVLYALDGTNNKVYQSTNGGTSWTLTTGTLPVASAVAISVAPDNTAVLAVANASQVAITSDSGSTWSTLPALSGSANWSGSRIMDIAVAPARSGTLLGREYVLAVANGTGGATGTALGNNGDVLIIGGTADWQSAVSTTTANITGTRDYIAVAITPNFVGDRSVVAIGAGVTAGVGSLTNGLGVVVQVINTASRAVQSTAPVVCTTPVAQDVGTAGTGVVRGYVTLPSDFDATTSSGRRAYIGYASATANADNDVYRVDDTASKLLGAVTSQGIWSVSYSGTVSAGTLFEVRGDTPEVKYSTDMTAGSPTWTTTKKAGPQNSGTVPTANIVMVAPDFATSRKVYLANSGTNSAFSLSTDGGISFNGKSLIDMGAGVNTLTGIRDLDLRTGLVYVSTRLSGMLYIWVSTAPVSDSSWTLLWCGLGSDISVNITSDSVIYFFDKNVAGGTIYRSADAGATWNTRMPPTSSFVISEFAFQDDNVGWVVDAGGNIYKTTNGAFIWTGPTTANIGTINGSTNGRTDELILGGTGAIAISKDGGATWTTYNLDAGIAYKPTKDENYTTNNVLYLRNGTTNGVERFTVGTDAKSTDILATNPTSEAIKALTIRSGVMYATYTSRIARSVNYTDTVGTITWNSMTTGITPGIDSATSIKDVDTIIYLRYATQILAYDDQLGTNKPVITSPADNSTLQVDPATGYGSQFNIVMQAMGSGNGLVDQFQVDVTEQSAGFAAASRSANVSVSSPATPVLSSTQVGLNALSTNKIYSYRIRAVHSISGESVVSPWSATRTVTVASGGRVQETQYGPQLMGPTGPASTTPGFAWVPIFGATKYRVKIATDAALTKTVGGTPADVALPSFQATTALTEGTTYFYSVQVIEPVAGPVSVGTFTTAAAVAKTTAAPTTAAPQPTITIPAPTISIPPQPTPTFTVTIPPAPAAPAATPAYIWAVIIIGAILVIAVIVLIVRTRKAP